AANAVAFEVDRRATKKQVRDAVEKLFKVKVEDVKTMNVPPDEVPRLAAMLDDASPALKAFLKPTNEDGKRGFTLDELIAIARRPA
ncbi:MAG: 50S ribosomal protein L23, partial [Parvibaculum sp.]